MLGRIVSIGNGTGQAAILKWLIQLEGVEITALVTTTDNGGSSALVRESLHIPAPGDVRNVINAINPKNGVLSKLLNYRFQEGELTGTHVWNLIVGALSRIQWTYLDGIKKLNDWLNLPALVYPVSNHSTQICAELEDGTVCEGEWQIIKREDRYMPVKRYFLKHPYPAVEEGTQAIMDADMIVICPGVLGSGIISTLLFDGMLDSIKESKAKLVYICNAMTFPSQTDGFAVSDHIKLLEEYTGRPIDVVLVCSEAPPLDIQLMYEQQQKSQFVVFDKDNIAEETRVIADNFLIDYEEEGEDQTEMERAKGKDQHVTTHHIRHDSEKIAEVIGKLL